jgi:type I site-specific restriction endonuclease
MAESTKLIDLDINETSGVDHPAHLHEGWVVMKSEDLDDALELIDEEPISDNTNEENVDTEATSEEESAVEAEEVVAETEEAVEAEPVEASAPEAEIEGSGEAVAKELTDLRKELDETRKAHEALKDERELEKAVEASHQWGILPELNPVEFAPVLRSLRKADPEVAEQVEQILTASATALQEHGMLKELGTSNSSAGDDAYAVIETKAKEMVTAGTVDSIAKGIAKVASLEPDLYERYLKEREI